MTTAPPPARQIRAEFDDETITVYQAFSPSIADPAIAAQHFVPPFSLSRTTWIKPSFLWMMYRSGWATKPGQERVLAVRLKRSGFERALLAACLSHFDPVVYADELEWQQRKAGSSVRVQWDPERGIRSEALAWRSLQVGLGGSAVVEYVDEWVVAIEDITDLVSRLRDLTVINEGELPGERSYPIPSAAAATIGASVAKPTTNLNTQST